MILDTSMYKSNRWQSASGPLCGSKPICFSWLQMVAQRNLQHCLYAEAFKSEEMISSPLALPTRVSWGDLSSAEFSTVSVWLVCFRDEKASCFDASNAGCLVPVLFMLPPASLLNSAALLQSLWKRRFCELQGGGKHAWLSSEINRSWSEFPFYCSTHCLMCKVLQKYCLHM